MVLTLWGVRNSPKTPEPQRYKSPVSWEMEALKEPALMVFIGMCEMSAINWGEGELRLLP